MQRPRTVAWSNPTNVISPLQLNRWIATVVWIGVPLLLGSIRTASSQHLPELPIIEENACPLEFGCLWGQWISEVPLTAYGVRGDTLSRVTTIPALEVFAAESGAVITSHLGIVRVRQPIPAGHKSRAGPLEVGDTVYVFQQGSLDGWATIWKDGEFIQVVPFWTTWLQLEDLWPDGLLLRDTGRLWWIRVTMSNGTEAWIAFPPPWLGGICWRIGEGDVWTRPGITPTTLGPCPDDE
jgi:hypothetical protein